MIRRNIALLLLLFVPPELVAQRYGRPDSAQNYGRVRNHHLLASAVPSHRFDKPRINRGQHQQIKNR